MQKIVIVFLVVAVCCVLGKEYTPVKQCGSEKLFKNVAITTRKGVCTKLPCLFKLGEELKVEIEFENKKRVEKIVSKCHAKVMGEDIDFPIQNADKGCDALVKGKCPAEPNSDLEIKLALPVRPPAVMEKFGIDTKLQFSLHDQNDEIISCFQLTAKVDII